LGGIFLASLDTSHKVAEQEGKEKSSCKIGDLASHKSRISRMLEDVIVQSYQNDAEKNEWVFTEKTLHALHGIRK
jgi:hypothetical protein